jgi:hypothetical protein
MGERNVVGLKWCAVILDTVLVLIFEKWVRMKAVLTTKIVDEERASVSSRASASSGTVVRPAVVFFRNSYDRIREGGTVLLKLSESSSYVLTCLGSIIFLVVDHLPR